MNIIFSSLDFEVESLQWGAVVRLVEMTVEGIKDLHDSISVFLDLSKVFYYLDHNILIHNLEYCRIRGVPLSWIKLYASNRNQFAKIADM